MEQPPASALSALDKLARAEEHINHLEVEFRAWLRHSYRVRVELDFQHRKVTKYVCQTAPLPRRWGIVIGDAVHDMRSALDHLAWALTIHHQRRMPAEPLPLGCSCWWRSVAFPIFLNAPKTWAPTQLRGVDPVVRDRIRDEQPFTARNHNEALRSDLWVLEELWNRDKHRSVLEIDARLALRTEWLPEERLLVGIFGAKADPFGSIAIQSASRRKDGPVKYGDEVEVFRIVFENEIPNGPLLKAYLRKNAKTVCDMEFDKGLVAPELGVRKTLRRIHKTVSALVESFLPDLYPVRRIARSRDHCPPRR